MTTKLLPGLPIVNMNGTSRQALVEQRADACTALRAAIKSLREMSPHGRDFQTAQVGIFEIARDHHQARVTTVIEMLDEIMAEAIELQSGGRT